MSNGKSEVHHFLIFPIPRLNTSQMNWKHIDARTHSWFWPIRQAYLFRCCIRTVKKEEHFVLCHESNNTDSSGKPNAQFPIKNELRCRAKLLLMHTCKRTYTNTVQKLINLLSVCSSWLHYWGSIRVYSWLLSLFFPSNLQAVYPHCFDKICAIHTRRVLTCSQKRVKYLLVLRK